jgi:hypothetical protein
MKTVFAHRVLPSGRRATLAAKRVDENDFLVSVAICSKKDMFKKAMGRMIAENRLLKEKKVLHFEEKTIPCVVSKFYKLSEQSLFDSFFK